MMDRLRVTRHAPALLVVILGLVVVAGCTDSESPVAEAHSERSAEMERGLVKTMYELRTDEREWFDDQVDRVKRESRERAEASEDVDLDEAEERYDEVDEALAEYDRQVAAHEGPIEDFDEELSRASHRLYLALGAVTPAAHHRDELMAPIERGIGRP